MRLRFIGVSGSLGLQFGQIYRLSVEPWNNGILITAPVRCPYESDDAFWRNWVHPMVELRTVMEARGRDLREQHLPRRPTNLSRETNSEVHNNLVTSGPTSEREDRPDAGSVVDERGGLSTEAPGVLDHDASDRSRNDEESSRSGDASG